MNLDRRRLLALTGAAGTAALFAKPVWAAPVPRGLVEAARTKHGAPAAGGMIVTRSGIPFLEVAGVRQLGSPEPVTKFDTWHIGSNTKAMTSALYALLVEKGRASWGMTLPSLFPDLAAAMHPAWKDIRIEQVMSHSAGIDDERLGMDQWIAENIGPHPIPTLPGARTQGITELFRNPPNAPVGKFLYSNAGYVVVGAAIERISKEPFELSIRKHLFDPLGMSSMGFGPVQGVNPWGHLTTKNGLLPVDPRGKDSDNPPAMDPAGTGHCSLQDYAKFLQLFLNQGGNFLKPATITKLTTAAVSEPRTYALGWLVLDKSEWLDRKLIAHQGSNNMWWTVVLASLDLGIAAVGVSNSAEPTGSAAARDVAGQLLKAAAGSRN